MLSLIEDIQILILGNDCLSESPYSPLFSVVICNKEHQPTDTDLTLLQMFTFSVPELQKPKECTRLSIHCCFKDLNPNCINFATLALDILF